MFANSTKTAIFFWGRFPERRRQDSNLQADIKPAVCLPNRCSTIERLRHKCLRRDLNPQWILVRPGSLARRIYQFYYEGML